MATKFVDLDVRPVLRSGGDPFALIMGTVGKLRAGEGLRLLASFKPTPLLQVLASKGFSHEARELEGGDWEVLFSPAEAGGARGNAAPAGLAQLEPWPEPSCQLDNRELDPPEPMTRILAATESMQPGEVLLALLNREPIFLFPELAKRGHSWRGGFEPDQITYKLLVRVGSPPGGPA